MTGRRGLRKLSQQMWRASILTTVALLTLSGCHQSNTSSSSPASASTQATIAPSPPNSAQPPPATWEPGSAAGPGGTGAPEPGPSQVPGGPGGGPAGPGGGPFWSGGGGGGAVSNPTLSFEDNYKQIAKDESQLITSNASWNAPKTLTVEKTQRVGLQIGQSKALSDKINQLLPNTSPSSAGQVKVGPLVRARLEANPDDADVTPSDFVNYSTASSPELLWTWMVRPKKPSDALLLTVHIEVPLEGSANALPTDIPIEIPVDDTFWYRAGQIFTNWGTWTAVAGTLGGFGWWKRRKQQVQTPGASSHDPT